MQLSWPRTSYFVTIKQRQKMPQAQIPERTKHSLEATAARHSRLVVDSGEIMLQTMDVAEVDRG